MLARFPRAGTLPVSLLIVVFGCSSQILATPSDDLDFEIKLTLAQEEVDKYCAWTDLKKDKDYIPRSDLRGSWYERKLLCRDAKRAAWSLIEQHDAAQKAQRKAMRKAEKRAKAEQVDPYSFDHAMSLVRRYCVFPDITHDSFKNRYIPLLNELGKHNVIELEKMCQSAKLQAIGIRDGTITRPAADPDTESPTGYGKEYRPPIRPNSSDGPLDLE